MNEKKQKNIKNKAINVSLPIEMLDFIDKQKKEKLFKSYAEFIRELIREKMN